LPEGDEAVCLRVVEKAFMFSDEIFWDLKEEGRKRGREGGLQNRIKSRIRKRSHVSRIRDAETPDRMMHLVMHELKRRSLGEARCHRVILRHIEDRILHAPISYSPSSMSERRGEN
jgi:hypothetical protein